MSAHEATPGGILLPTRTKLLCKFCGAAYDRRPNEDDAKALAGVRTHELQCRIMTRQRFVQAALSGPVAMKGGEAAVDAVDQAIRAIEAGERTAWKESF